MNISADERPSAKKLLALVIPHAATKWYELGAMLLDEDQENELELIQSNFKDDIQKCCSQMLLVWKQSHPKASWHALVEALKSPGVKLNTIASNIEKYFSGAKQIKLNSSSYLVPKTPYQEDYSEIHFEAYDNVSSAFSKLFTTVQGAIMSMDHDHFQMIRNSCVAQAKEPLCSLFKQAQNSHHLFGVLADNKPYCNWMRIDFLEVIASAHGKSLEILVQRYRCAIFSKQLSEVWGCISHISARHKFYTELKGKFDVADPDKITVEDLIKKEPLSQLGKKIELHIAEIQTGSLLVTWLMPINKLYQTYLSFLSTPQQSRKDACLQFGSWVAYLPQHVLQELQAAADYGNISAFTLLIGYYYGLLLRDIEPDLLIHEMCSNSLLTTDEYKFMTNSGHNACQKNQLLLEHVRHMDTQNMVVFCELLQNSLPQIGAHLLTALKSSNELLSTAAVGKPNLNIEEAEVKPINVEHSICEQYYKPSTFITKFLSLLDQVADSLKSFDYMLLVEQCEGLMASELHQIKLFSNKQIKDMSRCNNALSVLWTLNMHLTWNNHSILRVLVDFCDEAVKLLDDFDSKVDLSEPISACPVPQFSCNMTPTDHSVYTLLAIRCNQELYDCTLQYVYDIQSMLIQKCEITEHCLQLLAVRSNPTIFYWTIPNCIVDVISSTIPQCREFICSGGVLEALVYPKHELILDDVVCFRKLIFAETNSEEVCVTYSSKIVKDQIDLLQASDELLENALKFQSTHSDLLKLYLSRFKSRYLQLSSAEQTIVQIIKDCTGYTDDKDIDKEKEEWVQFVRTIEKTHYLIKEGLYSQDTRKMTTIQATVKNDSAQTKAAEEWGKVLEQAMVSGNNNLNKLKKIHRQNKNNPVIISVYVPIHRSVMANQSYLKAWIKWIEQIIKL